MSSLHVLVAGLHCRTITDIWMEFQKIKSNSKFASTYIFNIFFLFFNGVFALHSLYTWLVSSIGRLLRLKKTNCINYYGFHYLFYWWNNTNPRRTRSHKRETNLITVPGDAYSSHYCPHTTMPSTNWCCLDNTHDHISDHIF